MNDLSVTNSYTRSWQSSFADFAPVLEKLLAGAYRKCEVIYHTRHKECRLVTQEFSGLPYAAVLKLYREQRFFRYLLRPSMAYREFLGFKRASAAGIPAARVIALGEKRAGLRLKEAFFVTEYLAGFRDGDEFTRSDCDRALRDEFIRINLCCLAKLHKAGLVHGGFHPRNELFRLESDGAMTVKWIDLATVLPVKKSGRFTQEKDVERFMREFPLSEEEKAGFISLYRSEKGIC